MNNITSIKNKVQDSKKKKLSNIKFKYKNNNFSYTNNVLRSAYIELIVSNGPYEYFATLTLKREMHDDEARSCLKRLLLRLNGILFGRNKNNRIGNLDGFIIEENHKGRNGQPLHFHILFKYNNLLSKKGKLSFSDLFRKEAVKLKRQVFNKNSTNYVFNEVGIDIRSVFEDSKLSSYLTKCFEYHHEVDGNSIYPMTPDGF